ncbi:MAG: dTDP-4-dehydrorhamnose reductase, partial [Xanthobacteraceae bacterium]
MHGDIELVAPQRATLDLEDEDALAEIVAAKPWNAVINAAAYTDVDRAESEEAIAFAVNAAAPLRLAVETRRRGIPIIHISTDYVFDGRKGAPYNEGDKAAPINAYGRSKLAGERAVRDANPRHVILRTAWMHSPFRKNFVKTILRLAAERNRLTIVKDQRGCPTAARDVAGACLDIAIRCATEPERAPYGLYHFAGTGQASRFEFACAIVDLMADRLVRAPQVRPVKTGEYPTTAVRPMDTRLDCTAISRAFGIRSPPWRHALEGTIDRL